MIIWDHSCCISVNIFWRSSICFWQICSLPVSNRDVTFWTAPPSYFQPLVAVSVAAFLPSSISAWGRSFLANMPPCHYHFFDVLRLLLFHSLPHLSFVFSMSCEGSLEFCISFPLLWHYRLSFCHFSLFLQRQLLFLLYLQVLFQRHSNLYLFHLPFLHLASLL